MKPQYDVGIKKFSALENFVVVPTYQRRLVWSDKQKKDFIDSVSRGYPFGSILLYEYEDDDRFSLIDGLQRFSAISDYKKDPTKYYTNYDVYVDRILDLIDGDNSNLSDSARLDIREKIEGILRSYLSSSQKVKGYYIRDEIKKAIPVHPNNPEFYDSLIDVQEDLKDAATTFLDLDELNIPCIIYTGDESQLPNVFASLNQGGTKLSKYQVYAASWASDRYQFALPDDEWGNKILDNVIERYESLSVNRELDIDGFDRDELQSKRTINLAEFCYALGELIVSYAPVFWQKVQSLSFDKKEDTCNMVGYLSTAIALSVDNRRVDTLIEKVELFRNADFVSKLIDSVISVYKNLNNSFADFLRVPGKSDSPSYESLAIADMQALSFFASLFHRRFVVDEDQRTISVIEGYDKKGYGQIRKNLIAYCVQDIVTNAWQGNGDSRLAKYYVRGIDGRSTYLNPITFEDLEGKLLEWNRTICSSSSINVDKPSRLLLCIHANKSNGENQYIEDKYDIEHIISKQLLRTNDAYKRGDIPGGTLGNLMYLKALSNRSKGGRNLYSIMDDHEGVSFSDSYLEALRYPTRSEITTAESELKNGNYEPAKQQIENRAKDLIKEIAKAITYN